MHTDWTFWSAKMILVTPVESICIGFTEVPFPGLGKYFCPETDFSAVKLGFYLHLLPVERSPIGRYHSGIWGFNERLAS
jgi:hypothetical protein